MPQITGPSGESTRSSTPLARPTSSRWTSRTCAGASTPTGAGGSGSGSMEVPSTAIAAHGSRKASGIAG